MHDHLSTKVMYIKLKDWNSSTISLVSEILYLLHTRTRIDPCMAWFYTFFLSVFSWVNILSFSAKAVSIVMVKLPPALKLSMHRLYVANYTLSKVIEPFKIWHISGLISLLIKNFSNPSQSRSLISDKLDMIASYRRQKCVSSCKNE